MASGSSMPPKKPHASPLEAFPEYVKAIGMLTVEMGALEAMFVQLLRTMLRVDEGIAATILLTPKSTRARTEVIASLAEMLLSAEQSKRVDRLVKRANQILDKRNGIVHEFWGVSRDKTQVVRIPPPYGDPVPIELPELTGDITAIRQLADDVMYFTRDVAVEMLFRPHYRVNVTYQVRPESPG